MFSKSLKKFFEKRSRNNSRYNFLKELYTYHLENPIFYSKRYIGDSLKYGEGKTEEVVSYLEREGLIELKRFDDNAVEELKAELKAFKENMEKSPFKGLFESEYLIRAFPLSLKPNERPLLDTVKITQKGIDEVKRHKIINIIKDNKDLITIVISFISLGISALALYLSIGIKTVMVINGSK